MEDHLNVGRYMGPVSDAIKRHIEWPSDAYTDIYNRAYEAVYKALVSKDNITESDISFAEAMERMRKELP